MSPAAIGPFPIRGGVAVVTGAASGIGAGLASSRAARGCNLALADINPDGLAAVAARARSSGVSVSEHKLDVADRAAVAAFPEAVLSGHGRVNLLINNAGVALGGTFEQVPPEDFDWLFGINFWGVVSMTRAFLPLLRREQTAHLVNLSSVFGIVAPPGQVAYAASKFAVRGFSEALSHELEDSAVGITTVYPGGIRTSVDVNARRTGLSKAEADTQKQIGAALLRTSPEIAAEQIVRAVIRRDRRVLIGRDARRIASIQRLFPVGYWPSIARSISRSVRRRLQDEA